MSSPKSLALRRIANLRLPDTESWLALVEDQLRATVPPNSLVLLRFLKLKNNGEATNEPASLVGTTRVIEDIRGLIVATCDWLDAEPTPAPENLKEEVERIIQMGYFKSPYFKAILALFGIALLLITGTASFKIHDQVQAMQKMLDEARRQTADMAEQIAAAKAENKNREADLALLVAQGNVDLANQRAKALTELQQSTDLFRTDLTSRDKRWTEDVEQAGSEARQHVSDAGADAEKKVRKTTDSTLVLLCY
jgi:DNA-binding FrmR family transcriptional regulator